MTAPTEYLYSTDDEYYVYTSLTDCIESIYNSSDDYEDFETFTVFKAKVVPLDITTMCNSLAIDTINNCTDYIYERVGEVYDSRDAESKESRDILKSMIEQWANKYINTVLYKEIISEPEKLTLTSNEVRELLNA